MLEGGGGAVIFIVREQSRLSVPLTQIGTLFCAGAKTVEKLETGCGWFEGVEVGRK